MSTEYHKISTPFKRHFSGPDKGKLIMGDWAVPELEYLADNEWEFTEKVDGTNIRISLSKSDRGVSTLHQGRTDNANIPNHLSDYLHSMFPVNDESGEYYTLDKTRRLDLIWDWMRDNGLVNVTLYGEGYGPKIQKGGGNYRKDASFVLFDVKIGDFWLDRENVNDVAEKLGIDSVPSLGTGTLWQAINYVKYGTPYHNNEIKAIEGTWSSNWLSESKGLKSRWGDFEAEGIVARPIVPLFNRQGNRVITKIKGVDFR